MNGNVTHGGDPLAYDHQGAVAVPLTTSETARADSKERTCAFFTTPFEVELSLDDVAETSGPQGLEEQVSDKHYVRQLLATLTPREERVIRLRFGLGEYPAATLKSVGEEMGLTAARVRQIEMKARRKMRIRAVRIPLGLPRSDIERLGGHPKAHHAVATTIPAKPLCPTVSKSPAKPKRVMLMPPTPPPHPRQPSKARHRPRPQREPQFREGPPSPLRPWPRHIALFAGYFAPFALLDLIIVSEAARKALIALIGPGPTAALVLMACQLILCPLVLL
jgi:hypothetical protein